MAGAEPWNQIDGGGADAGESPSLASLAPEPFGPDDTVLEAFDLALVKGLDPSHPIFNWFKSTARFKVRHYAHQVRVFNELLGFWQGFEKTLAEIEESRVAGASKAAAPTTASTATAPKAPAEADPPAESAPKEAPKPVVAPSEPKIDRPTPKKTETASLVVDESEFDLDAGAARGRSRGVSFANLQAEKPSPAAPKKSGLLGRLGGWRKKKGDKDKEKKDKKRASLMSSPETVSVPAKRVKPKTDIKDIPSDSPVLEQPVLARPTVRKAKRRPRTLKKFKTRELERASHKAEVTPGSKPKPAKSGPGGRRGPMGGVAMLPAGGLAGLSKPKPKTSAPSPPKEDKPAPAEEPSSSLGSGSSASAERSPKPKPPAPDKKKKPAPPSEKREKPAPPSTSTKPTSPKPSSPPPAGGEKKPAPPSSGKPDSPAPSSSSSSPSTSSSTRPKPPSSGKPSSPPSTSASAASSPSSAGASAKKEELEAPKQPATETRKRSFGGAGAVRMPGLPGMAGGAAKGGGVSDELNARLKRRQDKSEPESRTGSSSPASGTASSSSSSLNKPRRPHSRTAAGAALLAPPTSGKRTDKSRSASTGLAAESKPAPGSPGLRTRDSTASAHVNPAKPSSVRKGMRMPGAARMGGGAPAGGGGAVKACEEAGCDCDDFKKNAFKAGNSCSNCFHSHPN